MGRHIERFTYLSCAFHSGSGLEEDDRKTIIKIFRNPSEQAQWMGEHGERIMSYFPWLEAIPLEAVLPLLRQVPFDHLGILDLAPILLNGANIEKIRNLLGRGAFAEWPQ